MPISAYDYPVQCSMTVNTENKEYLLKILQKIKRNSQKIRSVNSSFKNQLLKDNTGIANNYDDPLFYGSSPKKSILLIGKNRNVDLNFEIFNDKDNILKDVIKITKYMDSFIDKFLIFRRAKCSIDISFRMSGYKFRKKSFYEIAKRVFFKDFLYLLAVGSLGLIVKFIDLIFGSAFLASATWIVIPIPIFAVAISFPLTVLNDWRKNRYALEIRK